MPDVTEHEAIKYAAECAREQARGTARYIGKCGKYHYTDLRCPYCGGKRG